MFCCAVIDWSVSVDSVTVEGYSVPVDPMDLLQCDSCQ